MGILADWQIDRDVTISPFEPAQVRPGKISYGVSSYGYDARVGYRFKVFTNAFCGVVDPKHFDKKAFVDVDLTPPQIQTEVREDGTTKQFIRGHVWPADHILIPPNSFALAETVEEFDIPKDVLAVCVGKSTYARCGIIVNVTPLEPKWRGKVTVEISNTTPLPAKIYAGEGIMQVLFFRCDGKREELTKAVLTKWSHTDFGSYHQLMEALRKASCVQSYADKKQGGGKYQNQTGLTMPKVD